MNKTGFRCQLAILKVEMVNVTGLMLKKLIANTGMRPLAGGVSACLLAVAMGLTPLQGVSAAREAGKVFYRYVNEEGIVVLDDAIPPEYAQKGYEVVTSSGVVVKTVGPAPSSEEAEALQRQREVKHALQQWDEELLRRYSSVRDIESTKKRKLGQVQTSIEILKSNITNLKAQIANQQSKAADAERLGREVPKQVLTALAGLEAELKLTEQQLQQRRVQFQEVTEKYDNDKERFRIIRPEIR